MLTFALRIFCILKLFIMSLHYFKFRKKYFERRRELPLRFLHFSLLMFPRSEVRAGGHREEVRAAFHVSGWHLLTCLVKCSYQWRVERSSPLLGMCLGTSSFTWVCFLRYLRDSVGLIPRLKNIFRTYRNLKTCREQAWGGLFNETYRLT